MKVVVCKEFAPPSALVVEDWPDPVPGPGKVVVDVRAAGVNFVDALFVQGQYQIKPPTPFVPGSEIAGEITAVGEGVEGFAVGDRVLSMVGLGGYAQQAVVDAVGLMRAPDTLDHPRAATITQSYGTAFFALGRRGGLTGGEKLLVLGAAGGVGLAAVDVGTALGAEVIAAASTDEKLEACRRAGAQQTLNYTTEDLKARVRDLSGGGVDVVFDPVGGSLSEQALRTLRFDGRLLVIGFASGEIPRLPANQVLLRNRRVVGVDWGAWALADPAANATLMDEVFALHASGRIDPVAPSEYPLDGAAQALEDLLGRRITGKAVLVP